LTNSEIDFNFVSHKNPAMLTPLKYMAHVLLIFLITNVHAQSVTNNSMLCYVSTDNVTHAVQVQLIPSKPYFITCTYDNEQVVSLPQFFQFKCTQANSTIELKIHVADAVHSQYISKQFLVSEKNVVYELPISLYASNDILKSEHAKIQSIELVNISNEAVELTEINFSNTSSNYEVKLNQLFSVDLQQEKQRNYILNCTIAQHVNINLFNTNGGNSKKITKQLKAGKNVIQFDDMQLNAGKYVVTITENTSKENYSSVMN